MNPPIPYPEEEVIQIKKAIAGIKKQIEIKLNPFKYKQKLQNDISVNNNKSVKELSHYKRTIFRRQKILCTRNTQKELLTDKKELWKKIAPYNRYCDYCGDLNYKYGSELYGMDKSKNVVNWTKVVEDDDY